MANNRLYIIDTETKEEILLAKSFGSGWDVRCTIEQLNEWLEERDLDAAYGNTGELPTTLKLMCENDDKYLILKRRKV